MGTPSDRPKDIEAEATRWLIKLDATRTPELIARHAEWMAQSARHRVAYLKHLIAWKRMDSLRRLRPLDPPDEVDPDLLKPRNKGWPGTSLMLSVLRSTWTPRLAIGAAAVAALAICAAALPAPDSQLAYSTGIGGRQHVTLDDGSVLDLNTNTSVRVWFTNARRQILLDRGEVLLSVAHDTTRPLEVIAGDVVTRAVGTRFSVRRYDDGAVETLLTQGRVLMLRRASMFGVSRMPRLLVRPLVPGERVLVNAGSVKVSRPTAKEIEHALEWTTGHISFRDEPLSNVVRELNRYNTRPLVILDSRIAGTRVGGGFDTAHAEAYAEDLASFFGPKSLGTMRTASAQ